MDAKKLLDEILSAGRDLGNQGSDFAKDQFNLPPAGQQRDEALANMGKGAAVAGALALLLGTKSGRKMGTKAVKLGGLAALGGVAYKAYQNWQASSNEGDRPVEQVVPVDQDTSVNADQRSLRLLRAMIGAARADGHIDAEERRHINEQIAQLGLDASAAGFIQRELEIPLNPRDMAEGVEGPEEAAEVYLASLTVLDLDNPMEEAYLQHLADALGLDKSLVSSIHQQLGDNGTG